MATNISLKGEHLALTKHATSLAVVFVALLLVFHETAWAIVSTWYESNAFNHGFLILPICGYLAWRQRAAAATAKVAPDLRGLLLVTVSASAWLIGKATGTLLIEELSLVAIAQSIFLTMCGWPIARIFIFPLLYLYFAVPFGIELVPKLQAITASLAVSLLRDVGIPVFSDGNVIAIPTGSFYVAEECSGVRFLTASIAVGTLFAGVAYRSWWRRGLFMALAATIPIIANGVRAFGIIALTYLTNNEIASGVDHITYGWIFFTFVTFVLLGIGTTFRDQGEAAAATAPIAPGFDGAGRLVWRSLAAGLGALLLAAIAPLYGAGIDHPILAEASRPMLPETSGAWRRTGSGANPLPASFAAPDFALTETYSRDGANIYLQIGYYVANRRGAQIVSSDQKIAEARGWSVADAGSRSIGVGASPVTARALRAVGNGGGHIAWYWYWIDDRFTGNPYLAKLIEAKVKLFGGDPRAAIVAIGADYRDDPSKADAALTDFAATLTWLCPALGGGSAACAR